MKQIYLLLLLVVLSITTSNAQHVLTAENAQPTPNKVYYFNTTTINQVGENGVEVHWDFSNLATQTQFTSECLSVDRVPMGDSFPEASFAFGSGTTYDFTVVNSEKASSVGSVFGNVVLRYSDPADLMRFPMPFNSEFTDSFYCQLITDRTIWRKGEVKVEVDAYGTLSLPWVELENVVRLHKIRTFQDSSWTLGSPEIVTYRIETYEWYAPEINVPVVTRSQLETSVGPGSPIYSSNFIDEQMLNVKSPVHNTNNIQVFPNPAIDKLKIDLGNNESKIESVKLIDVCGNTVLSIEGGKTIQNINVSDLPRGVYFLHIGVNGIWKPKKIVLQ